MSKKIAAFVLLFMAQACTAAPPTLEIPAEVKPSNGYVTLRPKTDAKAVTYVALDAIFPFPSDLLADKRMFVLPVQGLTPGRYRFVAVGSLNDEHASVEFTVVVGTGPVPPAPVPPAPVPPTPPTPPVPVDPLVSKLKDAIQATGWKDAIALAAGFAKMRDLLKPGTTWGEFFTAGNDALAKSVEGRTLPAQIAAILVAETKAANLPTDPSAMILTDGVRTALDLYSRLGQALIAASK
jgi:hypothetical protein